MNPDDFYTVEQLQKALGDVSRQTVYNKKSEDPTFPCPVKLGSKTLYLKADVDAWFMARVDVVRAENAKRLELARAPLRQRQSGSAERKAQKAVKR